MEALNMLISGVIEKDGKKKACVRFEAGDLFAEGFVPDCKIEKQNGFTDEEIEKLEEYLRDNLETIKRKASEVDPILSMVRE